MSRMRLSYDKGTLLLSAPAGSDVPEAFVWDGRVGLYRAPGRAYRAALTWLHRSGVDFTDDARAYSELALHHVARKEPFAHQAEAVSAWVRAGRAGVVVLPTGAGKTFVAELAIAAVQRSALVVVPTIELMTQWYDRLTTAFAAPVGLVGGGYHDICDLTVTTYDSAYIHLEKLGNRFGLVIFDEVHHLPGPSYSLSAEGSIAPFRLGLTATPERQDGTHSALDQLVGPIVYRRGIGELRGDILAEYEVRTVEVELDAEERLLHDDAREIYRTFVAEQGIRLGAARGWQDFLAATARSAEGRRAFRAYLEQKAIGLAPKAKMRVVESILREHWGERALIFTNDNATAYKIARMLLVPVITHQTDLLERKAILDGFRAGTYHAIVTSRVLNEGVDVPAASVGVVLSGTGSVREHVQRLGRILRRGEDKRAVLYEVVTANTAEQGQSRRRREHDAYR
jgi:superfamily II DNA or RNA helicase